MGKWVAPEVLDGALRAIAAATHMLAVPARPADYAEAMAGRLAETVLGEADFAIGPGNASGRRIAIAAKAAVPVAAAGAANHVALIDRTAGRLLYVTTCPEQVLEPGGEVNFDGWSVEIGAPL
ncbi:hypothetical protein L6Q21_02055 [Sandaracinobacter sp. RS1-74]|uniref:hypothetical protein n=1 Tax=Sandaracinobacteroides sayramensis TaxID=2913411 RepID=UPI001EDC6A10|nr:hypothetical protein [Sandaracinobacteroides sayramensis]MCG2839764.1 hypothetical protein [Sandaracinobacteroides sayramensis]